MHVNDYAKWGGQCVKIISIKDKKYEITVLATKRTKEVDSCYPISLLKKGVLEACGFSKNAADKYLYKCSITPSINIEYHIVPLKKTYKIDYVDHNGKWQTASGCDIISCDGLQDKVRELIGLELNIDTKKLVKAAKNNQWMY